MSDKQRVVYVTVCFLCGGKTWSGTDWNDEHRPVGTLVWKLPEKTANRMQWCDCAAQAYEMDMREVSA